MPGQQDLIRFPPPFLPGKQALLVEPKNFAAMPMGVALRTEVRAT